MDRAHRNNITIKIKREITMATMPEMTMDFACVPVRVCARLQRILFNLKRLYYGPAKQ